MSWEKNTCKEWPSGNTWNLIKNRRDTKQKINNTNNKDEKKVLQEEYTSMNKEMKKSARTDKRVFYDTLATEAEQAAGKRDLSTLCKITRTLSTTKSKQNIPVKDSEGHIIMDPTFQGPFKPT